MLQIAYIYYWIYTLTYSTYNTNPFKYSPSG